MNEHHRRGIVSRVLRNAFFLQSVKNLYRRGERSHEGDKLQFYRIWWLSLSCTNKNVKYLLNK